MMWYVALPKYAAKSELPTYVSFWRPPIVEDLVFEPPSNSMMHTTHHSGFRTPFIIWDLGPGVLHRYSHELFFVISLHFARNQITYLIETRSQNLAGGLG